jgi:hypothetical protein
MIHRVVDRASPWGRPISGWNVFVSLYGVSIRSSLLESMDSINRINISGIFNRLDDVVAAQTGTVS